MSGDTGTYRTAGAEREAAQGRTPVPRHRPGMTIRTYRVAADGTRYGHRGPVTLVPDGTAPIPRFPDWPACACPRHAVRATHTPGPPPAAG
ncbi:hypothetical protein [Kitasatospora camelliae]|uniref:YD repeat-containing protein n=1 Tax=Kitasatospora camelliae TaxID=3156397 RepID=A0AAU8K5E5_9ACTN